MAKNGFKLLDSDMHIVEPPDLWERYIDPAFKAQAPRGWPGPENPSVCGAWTNITSGGGNGMRLTSP